MRKRFYRVMIFLLLVACGLTLASLLLISFYPHKDSAQPAWESSVTAYAQQLQQRVQTLQATIDPLKDTLRGTLVTAAQPHITSIGRLSQDLDLDGNRILNVTTEGFLPKSYIDVAAQDRVWLEAAQWRQATNVNGFINERISGVSLGEPGDRILFHGQTDPTENGVYVVLAGNVVERVAEAYVRGSGITVLSDGTRYLLTSPTPTLGSDALVWEAFEGYIMTDSLPPTDWVVATLKTGNIGSGYTTEIKIDSIVTSTASVFSVASERLYTSTAGRYLVMIVANISLTNPERAVILQIIFSSGNFQHHTGMIRTPTDQLVVFGSFALTDGEDFPIFGSSHNDATAQVAAGSKLIVRRLY